MATVYHAADSRPVRLTHFTPAARECWCWLFMRPELSLSGLQATVTGEVVDMGAGSTAWGSVCGVPSFKSAAEADAWAVANGFEYDLAEVSRL